MPFHVNARYGKGWGFCYRKTDLDGKRKRLTDLAKKNSFNLSLLNVHSVRHKCCHLRDFAADNSIDIFCMSKTWLYDDDCAIISALTPESHVLHHVPLPDKKGGGVDCLINKSLQSKKQHTKCFKSFECMEVQISNDRQKIILSIIYRPPYGDFSLFLQEIGSLILESEINETDVIYLSDFNIWVDDVGNNDAQNLLRLLDNFSLVNLVNEPTYNSGHTLDLVITKKTSLPC